MEGRKLANELRSKIIENYYLGNTKVYVEFDLGGAITMGFASHVSDAISIVGGRNIFDDKEEAYFTPDDKEIIERHPDVIIYEPKRLTEYEKERFVKNLKKEDYRNLKTRLYSLKVTI